MNRHEILKLQYNSAYPSLSITLPTHRTSPGNRQDKIRLRNLTKQATQQLLGEFSRREIEPLLSRLEDLAGDVNFRYTLDGLALFANQEFSARYYLPFTLPERVMVGDSFLTRDLVFAMNRMPRYWVLVLSEKPTRLFEANRDTLVEVREGGFPIVHEGPGGELSLPGGFGVRKSAYRDERHRQFFRTVDNALKPFLSEDPLPLIVLGVNRFLAFFREVSAHNDFILDTLNGSHDKTSPPRLAKLVWPKVEAGLAEKRKQYLVELDRAAGEQKIASSIGEVWRMANEGRGRLLLVEQDFHFSGWLDESGLELMPADGPAAPDVIPDAVDDIIQTVLSKQGQVVFTENGELEAHQRIALVLRY
jgi:hypothetical protein